jgi:hypothetical protein
MLESKNIEVSCARDVCNLFNVFTAPSWSWASSGSEICFPLVNDLRQLNYKEVWIAKVLEVQVTPSGTNPLGQVKSGFIRLVAPLRQSGNSSKVWRPQRGAQYLNWYDDYPPPGEFQMRRLQYHLLLGYRISMHANGATEIIRLQGLIIEPTGFLKRSFRRVGAFRHNWTHDRFWETGEYPLFADFDPRRIEYKEVMLV